MPAQSHPAGHGLTEEVARDSTWPKAVYSCVWKNNEKIHHPCNEICICQGWAATAWAVP